MLSFKAFLEEVSKSKLKKNPSLAPIWQKNSVWREEVDCVKELEGGLMKLTSHSYNSIDRLMQMIAKKHGITGKDLHNNFKDKHGKIPDDWIKEIK